MTIKIRNHYFILLALATCSLFQSFFFSHLYISDFPNSAIVSYGREMPNFADNICFGNYFHCDPVTLEIEGTVDTSTLGDYSLIYHFPGIDDTFSLSQSVSVVDNLPPDISVTDDYVRICKNGKIDTTHISSIDNYDGDISSSVILEKSWNSIKISSTDSFNNYSEKFYSAREEDLISPTISLNSDDTVEIFVDSEYNLPSPTVSDNCDDDIKIEKSGSIDTKTPGTYTITYSATDSSGNRTEIPFTLIVRDYEYEGGTIYLTFDDGPGASTGKLLDVLAKYGVKATFFVTARGSDADIIREHNEGHAIGLHTASHNYAYIYANLDNYFADLYQVQNRVKSLTGETVTLMRFPGGSSNTVSARYDGGTHIMSSLVKEVTRRGFTYFDWNLASGDAGEVRTTDAVYSNIVNNLHKGGTSVILQHDIKDFSVDAVESVIIYGLKHGYEFKKLDSSSFTAHHGVNN